MVFLTEPQRRLTHFAGLDDDDDDVHILNMIPTYFGSKEVFFFLILSRA